MIIRDLINCEEFIAGDKSILRELLHPGKSDLKIRYSLAHALVKVSEKTTKHILKTSEVYYILEGQGRMHVDDETENIYAGQAVYIPPGTVQFIENTGKSDLKFLCIVDPAWESKDEEIL